MAGEWRGQPRRQVDDDDRDAAIGVLRNAAMNRQISAAEYEYRLGYVYGARTVDELMPLVDDLPAARPPAERISSRRGRQRADDSRELREPRESHEPRGRGHRRRMDVEGRGPDTGGYPVWTADSAHPAVEASPTEMTAADLPAADLGGFGSTEPAPSPVSEPGRARSQELAAPASSAGRRSRQEGAASTTPTPDAPDWGSSLRACFGAFMLLLVALLLAMAAG